MAKFRISYDALLEGLEDGLPFGLLSQQTSPLGSMLNRAFRRSFKAVFSAEHGYFGLAGPGEKTFDRTHPEWGVPIRSLYGETRKPTPSMLSDIDRIVVDLQDIGVRCYTYLATLKLVLEAAAENGKEVVVLDRPVPLGGIVDGPTTDPKWTSFVAPARLPLCHGMTIGEEAEFLSAEIGAPGLKLSVVKMENWSHSDKDPWSDFLPPSPGIKNWDSAVLYPVTVFTEAYPALDTDRNGNLAFRVLGAEWMDPFVLMRETADELLMFGLSMREYRWGGVRGVLFSITDPERYRPAAAAMTLLKTIGRLWPEQLARNARNEWMKKLAGGESRDPDEWHKDLAEYSRRRINLYS